MRGLKSAAFPPILYQTTVEVVAVTPSGVLFPRFRCAWGRRRHATSAKVDLPLYPPACYTAPGLAL